MKLWLVRHGPPLLGRGICYGSSDVQADPQATLELADELAARLPRGLAAASSPLRRCTQLAEALRAARPDLALRTDVRIAEMDFGCWEGRRWDTIAREDFDGWIADFAGYPCGGGESVGQLMARVARALQDVCSGGVDALWITHAGVIRAARLLAAGGRVPRLAADWPREGPDFGQLACIEMVPPSPTVLGKTPKHGIADRAAPRLCFGTKVFGGCDVQEDPGGL